VVIMGFKPSFFLFFTPAEPLAGAVGTEPGVDAVDCCVFCASALALTLAPAVVASLESASALFIFAPRRPSGRARRDKRAASSRTHGIG
jgi:hypothetical protein